MLASLRSNTGYGLPIICPCAVGNIVRAACGFLCFLLVGEWSSDKCL